MLFIIKNILLILFESIPNLLLGTTLNPINTVNSNSVSNYQNIDETNGYTAVTTFNNGFIAVGTDGRIDRISINGEITKTEKFPEIQFTCILATEKFIIAAGENGKVVISTNNQPFQNMVSGTNKKINSLTYFDETVIAGSDDGELLIGDENGFFQMIQLNVKGNITSVASSETDCFGVTDEGELVHSTDGLNWNVFDFNTEYNGFYKPCLFKKVLLTENQIAVIGIHKDSTPVVLFSSKGNVWTERTLNYTDDNGMDGDLVSAPNAIYYDDYADEFYLACNNGEIVILPNCSHCNSLAKITDEDITGISCIKNKMIVVGENYFIQSFNIR